MCFDKSLSLSLVWGSGAEKKGNKYEMVFLMFFFYVLCLNFFFYVLCMAFFDPFIVLGFDFSLIWVKLKSMLLGRSFRFLFCRLIGWEVPLILLLCLVSGLGGSSFHMMDPDRASASSGGSNSISVGGRSEMGGSSRGSGWTSFDLTVLGEPYPNEEGEEVAQPNAQNAPANPVASPGGAQEQEALPQAPAPAEEAHSAEVSELKRELHALITERVREESEKGIGPLTTLFPEQRTLNSEVARHIMRSLEICSENDTDNIREWLRRIKQEKNLLKDLIGEYLPPKKR